MSTAVTREAKAEQLTTGLFQSARLFERLNALGAVRLSADYEVYDEHNPCALKIDLGFRIDRVEGATELDRRA